MHIPITRRSALKAAGISLSLPLLESMGSAIGGETSPAPKRMVLICNTLGLHPPSLFPSTPGPNYESTEYLELLKAHRNDLTLFSGLSHPDQNGKQPHDTEMTFLTSARNPGLDGFKNSISVDQFAAQVLGHATRFPSIALSSNSQKSQSYTANGVMLPADDRPSKVFAKLFLRGSEVEVKRTRRNLADGRSILDSVADQTRKLNARVSLSDRRQLDEYYASIRDAESEMLESEAWLDRPKPAVEVEPPQDILDPADLIGRTRLLMKLIPLILQSDSSRVITVVIQDHFVVPKISGVTTEHHNLSHHGQDPQKIKQLKTIESQILICFAELLSQMTVVKEKGQRLLDQTSILMGSNLGNANAHDPRNLPILLAGGNSSHGKYIAHNKSENLPLCNLFVHLLNQLGIETERFGTSTGTLSL